MTTADFDKSVKRDYCLEHNLDPSGTQWGVAHQNGTSLYYVGIVKDTDTGKGVARPASYPKDSGMNGYFTKIDLATAAVNLHLIRTWDEAEKTTEKYKKPVVDVTTGVAA